MGLKKIRTINNQATAETMTRRLLCKVIIGYVRFRLPFLKSSKGIGPEHTRTRLLDHRFSV
jgi:hypothetical protein